MAISSHSDFQSETESLRDNCSDVLTLSMVAAYYL